MKGLPAPQMQTVEEIDNQRKYLFLYHRYLYIYYFVHKCFIYCIYGYFHIEKILLFIHLARNGLRERNVAELYPHLLGELLSLCHM